MTDHVYGYCPACGYPGILRERRPNGNDKCQSGHTYPSRDAIKTPERLGVSEYIPPPIRRPQSPKIPADVKFPLTLQWFDTDPVSGGQRVVDDEETPADRVNCVDADSVFIFSADSVDPHGFGQDEIDRLEFIVCAANEKAALEKSDALLDSYDDPTMTAEGNWARDQQDKR